MIKAVIFDIDDTLTQTIKVKWKALKETAKRIYNFEISDQELKKYWGIPFTDLINKLFNQVDSPSNIIGNYYQVVNEFPARPHKNAIFVLNILHRNYILCVLTSSNKKLILKDLEDSGIDVNIFYIVQTQEDTEIHKPDPGVFENILLKLNEKKIRSKNILYVGDSLYDYRCAKGANLRFIAVTTGLNPKEDFIKEDLSEKLIIENLIFLPKLIKKLETIHI